MKEVWKEIRKFDGVYSISNKGRIRHNNRGTIRKVKLRDGKYETINIKYKGKNYSLYISRIVLLTFKPIRNPELYEADHKDWDTRNNCLSNLSWKLKPDNLKRRKVVMSSFKVFEKLLVKYGNTKAGKLLKTLL